MKTINERIEEIAKEVQQYPLEERIYILNEDIERQVIYYRDQWDILNEARPSTFDLEQIGETARTPAELSFWILYNAFLERFPDLVEE
jgi:hypothetical protein